MREQRVGVVVVMVVMVVVVVEDGEERRGSRGCGGGELDISCTHFKQKICCSLCLIFFLM